jgi:2-methylcitrate dehydratase
MVELVTQHEIDPAKVVSIEADVTQMTYDFSGGGLYGIDKTITTKEQADHNLFYLLAVAMLDHDVMPAQFAPERIARPDVQQLLKKVSARPSAEFTAVYPKEMPARIVVRLQDGTTFENEVKDFPGMPSRPFTWDEEVAKFDALVQGHVDPSLANEIKDAVRSLESIQVSDHMALLTAIPPRGA